MRSIIAGFVPNFSLLTTPDDTYLPFLEKTGEFRNFWETKIVGLQQDVMISAAATAVGINMTFFMPFVLLLKEMGTRTSRACQIRFMDRFANSLCGRNQLCGHCGWDSI